MRKDDKSKFLAKALGFYMLVIGLVIIFHLHSFVNDMDQILKDPGLLFISGFFTLLLGILVLVTHFFWKWGWPLVITLTGCWLFIKGLMLILFPDYLGLAVTSFIRNPIIGYSVGICFILFASILLFLGFSKHHD